MIPSIAGERGDGEEEVMDTGMGSGLRKGLASRVSKSQGLALSLLMRPLYKAPLVLTPCMYQALKGASKVLSIYGL